jgi:hypothetical protein
MDADQAPALYGPYNKQVTEIETNGTTLETEENKTSLMSPSSRETKVGNCCADAYPPYALARFGWQRSAQKEFASSISAFSTAIRRSASLAVRFFSNSFG